MGQAPKTAKRNQPLPCFSATSVRVHPGSRLEWGSHSNSSVALRSHQGGSRGTRRWTPIWGVGRVSWAPCVLGVRPRRACLLPAGVIAIALFKKGDVCRGQQPAHRCLSAPDARLGFAYLRLLAYFSAHPNAQYPAPSRAHLPLSTCLVLPFASAPLSAFVLPAEPPPHSPSWGRSRCPLGAERRTWGVCHRGKAPLGAGQSQRPRFAHFSLHAKWRSGGDDRPWRVTGTDMCDSVSTADRAGEGIAPDHLSDRP